MNMEQKDSSKPGNKILRIHQAKAWRLPIAKTREPKTGGISPLVLIFGFASLIAFGTILLVLPVSSQTGQFTSPVDALFTATSAVCVTGLAVVDTGTYWTTFGQAVILFLMQIGGFGFMTSATLVLLALRRRIGLRERMLIGEALGTERLGGLVKFVRNIAIFTLITEAAGALLFFARLSADTPLPTAAWRAVFQAVSAFNNCGFDLFGNFKSMAGYSGDAVMVLVTAILIILGGISFLVLADCFKARHFKRLSLNSKVVLVTTLSLLAGGTILFLAAEFTNMKTFGPFSLPEKVLNAFFCSVSPRTAGFSTIDIGQMTTVSLFFTLVLMFIGGASASTAGGIKVNTFGVLIATIISLFRGRSHVNAFGREFLNQQIFRAMALLVLSLALVAFVVLLLSVTENLPLFSILFETVSAFGTVGLSTGITPDLSIPGRIIILVTMFIGRLGPLTLVSSIVQGQQSIVTRYPEEVVSIG
jgi:trk system potassium uptake protein